MDIPPKIDLKAKARKDHLPLEMDGSVMKSKSFCGNAEPKITECWIDAPAGIFNSPKVLVKYDHAADFTLLFDYYPDEISFRPDEFIGLTMKQAGTLKFTKDKAYLQSP
jgi:hypothetical protein